MDTFINNLKAQFEDENLQINSNTKFRELEGWDSMTSLMVISMFDEIYGMVISSEALNSAQTVNDLYQLINK